MSKTRGFDGIGSADDPCAAAGFWRMRAQKLEAPVNVLRKKQNRMKTLSRMVFLTATIGFAGATAAIMLPSFSIAYNADYATEIFVATEGDKIDGELTVVESWWGTLRPGQKLHLPELAVFTNADLRTVGRGIPMGEWGLPSNPPILVSGKRMILFLKPAEPAKQGGSQSVSNRGEWEGANLWMESSVAWVEDGNVYTMFQINNPGPLVLMPFGTEAEMKSKTLQFLHERKELEDITKISDPTIRAERVFPFMNSNALYSVPTALSTLSDCKAAGIPFLRKMLNDSNYTNVHLQVASALAGEGERMFGLGLPKGFAIVSALARAGDQEIIDEVGKSLADDLQFWKENSPRLPTNWWDKVELRDPLLLQCRDRYTRTVNALSVLEAFPLSQPDAIVRQVRDYWLSLPQLDDALSVWSQHVRISHSQLVVTANRILARLEKGTEAGTSNQK